MTPTKTEALRRDTGITVSADVGVTTSQGVPLTVPLGLAGARDLADDTVGRGLTVPPGYAAALWSATCTLQVVRELDGSGIGPVITFGTEEFVVDQFPAPRDDAGQTVASRFHSAT